MAKEREDGQTTAHPGTGAPAGAPLSGSAVERKLRRQLRLARLILGWERLWPLLWPLPTLAALFVGLSLLDVLPLLPGWLHAGLLSAFAVGAVVLLLRLRHFTIPQPDEARRRIELDSGLAHRPLQILADRLAGGDHDPLSRALWQAERRRLTGLLGRLKLKAPAPQLARHDPLGLRFAAAMLLVVALTGGWHDWQSRIERAVSPRLHGAQQPDVVLQVWVTPPSYTGMAPMLLQTLASGQQATIPAGSKLLAELQGGHRPAQLAIDDRTQPFQALDSDSQRLETTLTKGHHLTIRQGRRKVGAWPIAVVPNHPPTIAFTAPPKPDEQGRLRFDITAHDDYGVTKAWALVRRLDRPQAEPFQVALPLGGSHPTDVHQSSLHDLTGHPWAGLKVSIQPMAEDGAGQQGSGEAVTLTLPERKFTNPVARAIVEQRRHLAAAPGDRPPVIDGLAGIASRPDTYGDDLTTFLALTWARSRLRHDHSEDAVPSVLDMLWQTALRLEDGDRPAAERALEQAQRELEQALAENAPQEQIERLMNQLQQAMDQYLDALAQQAAREGTPPPESSDGQEITSDDLQNMIDQMREMSRTGSREAAQQMLERLKQMMENLRTATGHQGSPEQAEQAQKAMNELSALTRDQRALLDQTFRRSQEGMPEPKSFDESDLQALIERLQQLRDQQNQQAEQGQPNQQAGRPPGRGSQAQRGQPQRRAQRPNGQPPAGQGQAGQGQQAEGQQAQDQQDQAAAGQQEALRKRLGELMQTLGDMGADIPDSLGEAEQAMRDSTSALKAGDMQNAVDAQTDAVDKLQQGSQQAMQAMSQQMGNQGPMVRMRGPQQGRDPLGRRLSGSGAIDENGVKIPDQADVKKAREVLDELRRRSGDARRPEAEREYLQRLLRQF